MRSDIKLAIFVTVLALGFLISGKAGVATAQGTDYRLLAPIPQLLKPGSTNSTDIATYIPAAVKVIIALAGGLAVIRIIIGGVQYMSTDAFTGKSDAKNTITEALIGFILVIGAYSILYTVNPRLLNFDFSIKNLPTASSTSGVIGSTGKASAEELNCTNDCTPLDASLIPVNGGACTNDPCYVNSSLNDKLKDLAILLADPENTPIIGWSVVKAFPTPSSAPCYQPGDDAGTCVDVAVNVNSTTTISRFLSAIKDKVGTNFQYIVPGTSTTSAQARVANLKKDIPSFSSYIFWDKNAASEHAHIGSTQ